MGIINKSLQCQDSHSVLGKNGTIFLKVLRDKLPSKIDALLRALEMILNKCRIKMVAINCSEHSYFQSGIMDTTDTFFKVKVTSL